MSHFSSQWRALATGLAIAVLTAACGGGGGSVATSDASLGSNGSTGTGTGSGTGSGGSTSLSISGQPAATATVGQAYSFQPTASAGTLTFSATNLPTWLSINSSTGVVSGTPTAGDVGTDSNITITVSSGSTSASLTAFTITVNAAQTASGSAVLNWTAPTQNTDGTSLTLSGYKILYGTSPTALTQSISVTNPSLTTYTVDGLSSGTWYFAIVSMDGSGSQSVPTNVASTTI